MQFNRPIQYYIFPFSVLYSMKSFDIEHVKNAACDAFGAKRVAGETLDCESAQIKLV